MRLYQIVTFCCLAIIIGQSTASPIIYYGAGPAGLLSATPYSYGVHSNSLITPTQTQYHTQDELGQYSYGYAEPHSSKHEIRSLDGITRGTYSYRDAEGRLQTVDYTADAEGFHVAATNLPKAPQPEALPTFRATDQAERGAERAPATGSTDTIELAAADTDRSATIPAGEVRLAGSHTTGSQSDTLAAHGDRLVELPDSVANTHAVAIPTGKLIVPTTVVRPFALGYHHHGPIYAAYSSYPRYLTAGGLYL